MEYLPLDDYDFEIPPETNYNYEVIIHIIFMEPVTVKMDAISLFNLLKDFKSGKILPIDHMIINSKHIKMIEIHKENKDEFIN